MNTVCEKNNCNACNACVCKCPTGAIEIVDDIYSMNAIIDTLKCINCNACHEVCPSNRLPRGNTPLNWFQGWAKDRKIRLNSSSGGIAAAIIKYFIESGGYVCSCVFEKGRFGFKITNNPKEYGVFAGSKYVKSNTEQVFKEIFVLLKTGEKVLFVGLPCQAAGLKNFIPERLRENLVIVDLICHGTPSPKLLKIYFGQHGQNLENCLSVKFRQHGKIQLIDDKMSFEPAGITDGYLVAFLNAICYTENCYKCDFANSERISDITLGDNWGTNLTSELKDGVSLIICNTDKGLNIVSLADIEITNADADAAKNANGQLLHPSQMPQKRNEFIACVINGKNIDKMMMKYFPRQMIKQKIKKTALKMKLIKSPGEIG